jgi:hypothetical protein
VAPLERALPLPQMRDVARSVCEDLDLHMACARQILLEVEIPAPEGPRCLGAAPLECLLQLVRPTDHPKPRAPPPRTASIATGVPGSRQARKARASSTEVGPPQVGRGRIVFRKDRNGPPSEIRTRTLIPGPHPLSSRSSGLRKGPPTPVTHGTLLPGRAPRLRRRPDSCNRRLEGFHRE